MTVADVEAMEKEHLLRWLPKLASLTKIIDAIKARAHEHLTRDSDFFDGEWVLKPGAEMQTIVDAVAAAQALLSLEDENEEKLILPSDLMAVAQFRVTDLREVYANAVGIPVKAAKEALPEILGDALKIENKKASLKQGTKLKSQKEVKA
jgi:hypothetical protein